MKTVVPRTVNTWIRAGVVAAALLGLSACGGVPTSAQADQSVVDMPADALMVVIDDPRPARKLRGSAGPGYAARLAYDADPAVARRVAKLANRYGLEVLDQWPVRNLVVHCFVISAPSQATLSALESDPQVRWVQPFNQFSTRTSNIDSNASFAAGDIYQFADEIMDSEPGKGVRIAVIDTSVDQSHPDLSRSKVSQANYAGRRGRPDLEEHGTAVVGLISANSSSPKGIEGLAHNAEVRVLRGCWQPSGAGGRCNTLTLALSLDAAIDMKPDIVNLSLTGGYDRVLQELVQQLLDQGTLVVAAFDEGRAPSDRFPAPRKGLIYAYGVGENDDGHGSIDDRGGSGRLTPVSHDSTVSSLIKAPRKALSIVPNAGYGVVSGHSIAAPQISAVAARLMASQPRASRDEIQRQLVERLSPN